MRPDPHVPFSRVEESAGQLSALGARVKTRRYDQLNYCRELLAAKGTLK